MKLSSKNNKLLSRDEYFSWLKTLPDTYCPFCDASNNIVIKSTAYWRLILCRAPYWKYHFMLIPKRHFKEYFEMSAMEHCELFELQHYTFKKLVEAELTHSDGSTIDRYLFFWRFREDSFDPITQTLKPDHFHFHIVPEKEHLWDAVLDEKAADIDIDKVRELFK
jgi:diadenosine tetraphosphate (Ap4A) HIT family hydrolase